jgi:hypothetical protein
MDKIIYKSVIIIGVLIVSFLTVIFFTSANQVFAVEYNTYTSETFGIEFQYPSEWEISENSNFDEESNTVNDLIYIINKNAEKPDIIKEQISIHKWNENGEQSLETFTKEVLEFQHTDSMTKLIEGPIIVPSVNQEIGTFLLTQKSFEDEEDGDYKAAVQFSTILANGQKYFITFVTPINTFNNPENAEVFNQFITSLKFVSDDKNK